MRLDSWKSYVLYFLLCLGVIAAQQTIDVGSAPDAGDGDTLRAAFVKTNDNFTELYTERSYTDVYVQQRSATRVSRSGLNFADQDYISVANGAFELGTGDFTVVVTLRRTADASAGDDTIWFSHTTGNNYAKLVIGTDDELDLIIDNAGTPTTYSLGSASLPDDSQVTHLVVSADRDANCVVYTNGESVSTTSISTSSAFDIGSGNSNAGSIGISTTNRGFQGEIYDFFVYSTALDSTAVNTLLVRGDIAYADQWANVAWAGDFEGIDGVNNVLSDRTSNGNNGTLTNMTAANILRRRRALHINAPAPATGEYLFSVSNNGTLKVAIDEAGLYHAENLATDVPVLKAAADAITSAGTVSHQIPVNIGGTVYYLVAYTHGS